MVDLTRRFFLGGAISLVAATTFAPSVSAMMNLPTIYGDGVQDDTAGLGALLRNEPCTFNKEKIGVEDHKGITFHKGRFVVSNTITVPRETLIKIEQATFVGKLPDKWPFFLFEDKSIYQLCNKGCIFEVSKGHVGILIDFVDWEKRDEPR